MCVEHGEELLQNVSSSYTRFSQNERYLNNQVCGKSKK